MGQILHFMFIDTVLAALIFRDDGTCETFYSQSDCLRLESLNQIDSLCLWDRQTATCSFNNDIGTITLSP